MRPRRIVHIIDRLNIGGAQNLLLTAARQAQDQGWDLQVITLSEAPGSPIPGQLQELGVTVHQLTTAERRALADTKRLHHLRSLIRRLDADIVHTHLRFSTILGAVACAGLDVARIATLHTVASAPDARPSRDELERWALRHGFHSRIAVGPSVQVTQEHRLGRPVHMVPNPVDIDTVVPPATIADLRASLLGGAAGPIVLTAGRITAAKALTDLVHAFDLVRHRFPHAVLVVAGGGELLGELRLLAAELGIAESVRFLGPRDDVPTLMRAADLFALSSVQEGLPLVVLEAMAAGLPVVATDVGDVAYALNGHGIVVRPRQDCLIAAAILEVLTNPLLAQRLGQGARTTVIERNAPDAWADELDRIYDAVAPHRRPDLSAHLASGGRA